MYCRNNISSAHFDEIGQWKRVSSEAPFHPEYCFQSQVGKFECYCVLRGFWEDRRKKPLVVPIRFAYFVAKICRWITPRMYCVCAFMDKMTLVLKIDSTFRCTDRFIQLQAQFVLCIAHTIRAMFAQECDFPRLISFLLLLNASIFFVLFMNFYIQNYKKRRIQEQATQNTTKSSGTVTAADVKQKVLWTAFKNDSEWMYSES